MPAFYVSDLDGTLLRNDGSLSESARRRLGRLIADGLTFSVASARSVISMQPLLKGLKLSLPIVEFNGAFVSNLATGRHEIVNAIDPAVATEVFASIRERASNVFVATFDGVADRLYFGDAANDGERHYVSNRRAYNDCRLAQTRDFTRVLSEQVVCLTVIGTRESLTEIRSAVEAAFGEFTAINLFENRYSPGWFWLTIHDRRATKDQAIQAIIARYGLDRHELVVFGDHENDVTMFRRASLALAVANAEPSAKREATHVIGSNEDDSVVGFIEQHYESQAL